MHAVTRPWAVSLLLLVAASLAAAGAGATQVRLIWVETTGSGVPGGSTIAASAGDLLTLAIVVEADAAGVSSVFISLDFDPGALQFVEGDECPSPPNATENQCGAGVDRLTSLTEDGPQSFDNVLGVAQTFEAETLGNGPANETFTLAYAVFQATGLPGSVSLFYTPDIDVIADNNGVILANSSNPTGVPLFDAEVETGPFRGEVSHPLNEHDPDAFPFESQLSLIGGTSPNLSRGWRFRVNTNGVVLTQIGTRTLTSDSDSHTVTLFDYSSQAVLAQGITTPGAGWRWIDVDPLFLAVGRDYVVAVHEASDTNWSYIGLPPHVGVPWFPNVTEPIQWIEELGAFSPDPSTFPTEGLTDIQQNPVDAQWGVADIGYVLGRFDVAGIAEGVVVDPHVGPPPTSRPLRTAEPGTILDLNVTIHLVDNPSGDEGTWWDDMTMTLTKGSTSITLNANPMGSSFGIFHATFDDEAANSIAAAKGGNAAGKYRPDGKPLDLFDGLLLAGDWTLSFQDSWVANDSLIESWRLDGTRFPELAILACDQIPTGGDNANQRGIRFHVDEDFQGVRLAMMGSVAGTWEFDAELRRSSGFTGVAEQIAQNVTAYLPDTTERALSVLIPFDPVLVLGTETFTLKFTNIVGPGAFLFFAAYPIGSDPCPGVEVTAENDVAVPTERSDPGGFKVIAIPEPGAALMLAAGCALLLAICGSRVRR